MVVLAAELAFAMINGLRGGVVWVVCAIGAVAFFKARNRALFTAGVLMLACAPLFSWLHTTMRYTTMEAPVGTTNWQMIPRLVEGMFQHSEQTYNRAVGSTFLEQWAIRAEGPRNATVLDQLYDQGDAGSFKPMMGAILFPIPRIFWFDKPAAGSTDSTNIGSAIYLVERGKPNASFYDMGAVLASAHAYWEGGWPWLILAGLLTGRVWNWLFAWAERTQSDLVAIILLTFTTALPVDGFFSSLTPLWAYLRLVWITVIPLLVVKAGVDMWSRNGTRKTARRGWAAVPLLKSPPRSARFADLSTDTVNMTHEVAKALDS